MSDSSTPALGIKPDYWIDRMCREHNMIDPYLPDQVRTADDGSRVISYGRSSYGYDLRVADEFEVFSPINASVVDPKNFDPAALVKVKGDYCLIPPNSFALARTVEYFRIPLDVLAICVGKSTLARCGVILNTTPFEPGWCGYATLEISNTTPLPAKIYANEGIGQLIFLQGAPCETTYADRSGKYQDQRGIVTAKV